MLEKSQIGGSCLTSVRWLSDRQKASRALSDLGRELLSRRTVTVGGAAETVRQSMIHSAISIDKLGRR